MSDEESYVLIAVAGIVVSVSVLIYMFGFDRGWW